jgi:hypothetical protein
MPPVGAILDLPHDAHPVLLKGVVALDDRLQLEALRRVADLLASERVEPAVDVFLGDLGRDLLDPKEVLLVQGPQSFDSVFEFVD